MKDKHWLSLVALFLMATGLLLAAETVPPREGVVSSNSLAVRPKPATFYERLGVLNKGDIVRIVQQQNDWYEILLPDSIRGWVRSEHLDVNHTVNSDTCFLHTGAGDMFTNFHHIPPQTKLEIIGVPNDGWCQVIPPKDATAWVSAAYITFSEPSVLAALPTESTAASAEPLPDITALEEQRNKLKEEHARQQENLQLEQQRLADLRAEAEKLKQETQQDSSALSELQREIERLQLLKENAEVKAALARSEREKALLQASEEQRKLEKQKLAAEAKAKTMLSEKDKWDNEAKQVAEALAAVREEARLQSENARAEADQLEQEKLAIVQKAEAALTKAQEAEDRRRESEQKQTLTEQAILALQADLALAEKKVDSLKQERERMEAATKEEAAKLETVRLEADRLSKENSEIQQRLEAAKLERLALNQQKLADEKLQQELKTQEAAQEAAKSTQSEAAAAPEQPAASEIATDGPLDEQKPSPDDNARQRILLTAPAAVLDTPIADSTQTPAVAATQPPPSADQAPEASGFADSAPSAIEPAPTEAVPSPVALAKQSGVVISLKDNASTYASHVICESRNFTLVPICYLHSSILDLRAWENLLVEVTGEEITIPGWTRPVLKVNGIIRK